MLDRSYWKGRRVLVTGHTGFKGSWLSLWLQALGADVTGFALEPPTQLGRVAHDLGRQLHILFHASARRGLERFRTALCGCGFAVCR
jgi:nucleoside-diphosphate-sugar epimerase